MSAAKRLARRFLDVVLQPSKTATFVRQIRDDHQNDSAEYRLDPPLPHGDMVFVSSSHFLGGYVMALDAIMGRPARSRETMVFPLVDGKSDYSGDGLAVVYNKTDHAAALKKIGYKIVKGKP